MQNRWSLLPSVASRRFAPTEMAMTCDPRGGWGGDGNERPTGVDRSEGSSASAAQASHSTTRCTDHAGQCKVTHGTT